MDKDIKEAETLKPCPFCGSAAVMHEKEWYGDNELDGWFIQCEYDDCPCQPRTYHFGKYSKDKEMVIKDWNNRA